MSDNPVAIVTGGSRGVGAATAIMLSENGWNVVITCSSSIQDADQVAKNCTNENAEVVALQANVSKDIECIATINKAIEKWERIDALINNAGTTKFAWDHSDLDALDAECKHIIYAGHSMGGAVGVLRAVSDERIKALVSLAGMVNTGKFAETEFGEVVPGEGNMWDDEDCPLSQAYMDDLRGIGTLVKKGSEVRVPWILVHGTEDDVVLIEDTHDIIEQATGNHQKLIIDGADHVFSQPEHMREMVEGVTNWLKGQADVV